jgi:hypothetical protein
MYTQLITPNPDIECRPGWCLQYVRQTYDLPTKYGSATEAWEQSTSQHPDTNFPADSWIPVWFALANEPAGHVALRAPDGSVYSTSDLGNKPHHHPTLDDLMSYYAYYGMPLTYLGWTEDVASFPVVAPAMQYESTTVTPLTEQDETMYVIAQKPGEDAVWIGNFVTRTQLPDMQTVKDTQYLLRESGAKVMNDGNIRHVENLDAIGKAI